MTAYSPPKELGFIGLGLMGVPMCERLLQAGYSLTVWNRNPEKAQPLLALGAKWANSPNQLAQHCDTIMLCVSDTAAVEAVVFGAEGVALTAQTSCRWLVDFSSIDPQATKEFAQRLHTNAGIQWIDCPVSGGVPGAEQGSLIMMAGGSAEVVAAVQPVLDVLSQRVSHMGGHGAGQITKLCNQMVVGCNVLAIAEMMAMAETAGVDVTALPTALTGGFADSKPFQLVAPLMASHHYEPQRWHVKTLLKDLNMAQDFAQSFQQSVPMVNQATQYFKAHSDAGFAEQDPATLVEMFLTKINKSE